ncbi:hypothetical protein [Streptomyces noursei]|uniref:Uncharacterized protein n=1 Tax=Streptomyces noursei TaxID=1971 RepID=A0A2N8PQS6_STRNR|nr:hypothetical protein [Streptomyces noursei]PNE43384.1 hypothetical protein AOB60_00090 [Streptomyces noursei]
MAATPDSYDPNVSHAHLVGMLEAIRDMKGDGLDLSSHQELFFQHFGAINQAALVGRRLPDAWHTKPGMQTDHPHMTTLASSGDRVVSEENRNILKEKCGAARDALEAWKQLRSEGDNPRGMREELERAASEAENVLKHLQVLGVLDGLFDGWEI